MLASVATVAQAAPINYTINFTTTTGTIVPTGQFTYDSAIVNPFSAFTVTADLVVFDFTAAYNSSTAVAGATCPDPGSAQATFAYLTGGCDTQLWTLGVRRAGGNLLSLDDAGTLPQVAVTSSALSGRHSGTFTVTEATASTAPEPGTVLLTMFGLVGAAGARWRSARRNAAPPAR